ncbi:MAG: GTPase HflX [Leptolinea sp.]|jgi:GTP-binding protein HflX|nr:GTPase HflX [Leptolinea sp.]
MSKRQPEPTRPPRQRAFLVAVEIKGKPGILSLEDSLDELALLADTAGLDVVGQTYQKIEHIHPGTFIGSGKIAEIVALVEEFLADVVIFDNELSPTHQRELEEKLGSKVQLLDRTALILDIFAQHAQTREGSLQVELAQYEYRLPRLTRAWTHLARQAGGGGGRTGSVGGVGLRGPGETQLEVDRREINKRISHLKGELEKVRAHRLRYRAQRKRSQIPIVALVGYTNAGKSTLLNRLSHSEVYVADQLFATLDPTTRRINLPGGHLALLTDTVGFIQKLPTQLVAAFRATLEEISEADLLIHVVDITHPNALAQWESVQQTLKDIKADHIPVVTVFNKMDRLEDRAYGEESVKSLPNSALISARNGEGLPDLIDLVEKILFERFEPVIVRLPYQQGHFISLFHEMGQVERFEQDRSGVIIHGHLPGRLLAQFQPFLFNPLTEKVVDTTEEEELPGDPPN